MKKVLYLSGATPFFFFVRILLNQLGKMMKRFFLFCGSCLFACALMAHPIDKVAAHKIAVDFFSAEDAASARQRKSVQRDALDLRLVYPVDQATRSLSMATPAYYVFAGEQETGFVIVAGDDEVKPIIGYSQTSNFDVANIPPALQAYLSAYEQYVEAVRSDEIQPSLAAETAASSTTTVFPFITTTWSQGTPYNNWCVFDGTSYVTGCVATAMAQIMNYYEWPKSAAGEKFIITVGNTQYYAGFESEYDWDNMLDNYVYYSNGVTDYTSTQADAVARLMRDAGYAVGMSYQSDGSGANHLDACMAMLDVFGYSPKIRCLEREFYSDAAWREIIGAELLAGRPILYRGQSEASGGHAFVCCGMNETGYYINWGWGGWCDGYFDLDVLALDYDYDDDDEYDFDFSYGQAAIVNIQPIAEGECADDYAMPPYCGVKITGQDKDTQNPSVQHTFTVYNYTGRSITGKVGWALYKDGERVSDVVPFWNINSLGNYYYTWWESLTFAWQGNAPSTTSQTEIRYLWSTDNGVTWQDVSGDMAKIYMNNTPVGHSFSAQKATLAHNSNAVTAEGAIDVEDLDALLTDETITSIDLQYAILDNVTVTPANPNALLYAYEGALGNTSNVVIDDECENLLITDGYPFVAEGITAAEARYVRKLDNSKYGTVVLPFAPDAATMAEYSFYTLDSQEGNVLNFRIVDEPEANTPYLYKNKVEGAEDFTASDVEVSTAVKESAVDSWTMKGTYEKLVYTDSETLAGLYYISNNQVKNATKTLTIRPFRVYFEGDANAFAAQSIGIRLEGTTEILPISTFGEPDTLYDLFGRRIESVPQGYYIKNGKKYYGK